ARNLKKRVSSYFQRRPESPRTEAMVLKIHDIAMTVTASEAEALILEHNLIKQLKPRYNVLLKDAKSYPYILLTDESYPRLKLYRGNRNEPGEYFGPFPNASAVHATLHIMQKIFRIRDCENAVFANRSRPCMQHQIGRCSAPCCHVISPEEYAQQVEEVRTFLKGKDQQLLKAWEKTMQTASENMNFEQAALLRDRIRALRTILAGTDSSTLPDSADAIAILRHAGGVTASIGVRRAGRDLGTHTVKVDQAIDADDLEILQSLLTERYQNEQVPSCILLDITNSYINKLKELIRLIRPGTRTQILIPRRGARAAWLKQIRASGEQTISSRAATNQQSAFDALAELFGLEEVPQRIAAVDNAHLGGRQMVAAIVYADWNGADKDHYRRYKLEGITAGDDYAAMQHVLSRFFRAINEDVLPEPDLMLIDGGRGQLHVAMTAAADHGLSTLRLVGVAKGKSRKLGEETLWPGWKKDCFEIGKPLKPGRHSPALMLIARVRDEAHRFAGSYMRKRKKKSMFTSALDGIAGIGPARRAALLKHFGGIEGVKKSSKEGLCEVEGISRRLAD
ncbi:MAG: excinuclease ABC subunit UvrC, partial [Mariprofundaceae bacterium]